MSEYASAMRHLIEVLKRLPGIGPRSAQRIAFHILEVADSDVEELTSVILEAKKKIKNCLNCFNISDKNPCEICSDKSRDESVVCVVEEPKDLIAIERTKSFHGIYHVLGGVISPLDGLGIESLRIKELIARIKNSNVSEIVLALSPTTQGDITVAYLMDVLKHLNAKVTRIAYGVPLGGDLDYVDELTLSKSLEGRREIHV